MRGRDGGREKKEEGKEERFLCICHMRIVVSPPLRYRCTPLSLFVPMCWRASFPLSVNGALVTSNLIRSKATSFCQEQTAEPMYSHKSIIGL